MGGGPRLQVHSAYGSVSRLPESKAESIGTGASHHGLYSRSHTGP